MQDPMGEALTPRSKVNFTGVFSLKTQAEAYLMAIAVQGLVKHSVFIFDKLADGSVSELEEDMKTIVRLTHRFMELTLDEAERDAAAELANAISNTLAKLQTDFEAAKPQCQNGGANIEESLKKSIIQNMQLFLANMVDIAVLMEENQIKRGIETVKQALQALQRLRGQPGSNVDEERGQTLLSPRFKAFFSLVLSTQLTRYLSLHHRVHSPRTPRSFFEQRAQNLRESLKYVSQLLDNRIAVTVQEDLRQKLLDAKAVIEGSTNELITVSRALNFRPEGSDPASTQRQAALISDVVRVMKELLAFLQGKALAVGSNASFSYADLLRHLAELETAVRERQAKAAVKHAKGVLEEVAILTLDKAEDDAVLAALRGALRQKTKELMEAVKVVLEDSTKSGMLCSAVAGVQRLAAEVAAYLKEVGGAPCDDGGTGRATHALKQSLMAASKALSLQIAGMLETAK
ncbi:hypothetical protein QOT17_000497 [Balamuthia mandrillaris]